MPLVTTLLLGTPVRNALVAPKKVSVPAQAPEKQPLGQVVVPVG